MTVREIFILLHRYAGLAIALFLFVSGTTGAIISWDHELDDLLNPHLLNVKNRGPAIPPFELARQVETSDPRVRVTFVPLAPEADKSLAFGVSPRVNSSTAKLHEPGYNQVFVDPVTGKELGKREWGASWPITRENFVSFLYVLHYSLHIPEMGDIDHWGMWLLGGIAILWTLDCFVALVISFPNPARWMKSFVIHWKAGGYRLNFDLHRAGGLWTWGLLFILAFTAFSLNLYSEIFYPVMSTVSKVTPSPFELRKETDKHQPIEPKIGYAEIIERAQSEAQRRSWTEPAGSVSYSPNHAIYSVSFFKPGDDHGAAGVGPPVLYFDSTDGRLLGDRQPWKGTAADIFVQAQFPLHSGRILGLPGRILISFMGLMVATLSVTGVVIWWRKRQARLRAVRMKTRAGKLTSELLREQTIRYWTDLSD